MIEHNIQLLVESFNNKYLSSEIILIPTDHFLQRCNDARNIPPIKEKELKEHLSNLWNPINQKLIKENKNDSFLLKSRKRCINLAIERKTRNNSGNIIHELLLVTIMRKCDFKPNSPNNILLLC